MKRLLALLAVLALTACGSTLDHGRIVGKAYEPEREWTMLLPIEISCVKSYSSSSASSCTPIYTWIPFVFRDDADWRLDLEACDDPTKCKRGHAYVAENEWEHLRIGQYWTSHPGTSTKDDVTKSESSHT